MKKLITLILLSCISEFSLSSEQVTKKMEFTVDKCDITPDVIEVRYGAYYTFFNSFNNNTEKTVYLNDYGIDYWNFHYIGLPPNQPNTNWFRWTKLIKEINFAIEPKTTDVKFIESDPDRYAQIVSHTDPDESHNSYHFAIQYKSVYDYSNNVQDKSDDQVFYSCQPYRISWCGDGILDNGERGSKNWGETCDPNDGTETNWSSAGCRDSCVPK